MKAVSTSPQAPEETLQKHPALAEFPPESPESIARRQELNERYLNMLSFVAHELRSPLISILGFADLMLDGHLGQLSDEQRRAVDLISRVSRNLIDMTTSYLDLAKIESGALRLHREHLELNKNVIEATLAEMKSQFAVNDLQAVAKAGSLTSEACLEGDHDLLKMVFSNVFSNAVKYARRHSKVIYNLLDFGDHIYVSIKNEGSGVPPEQLESIFHKFARLETEQNTTERGTGLGLYHTRCIVNAHGGRAWAESESGQWFKLCILLPKRIPEESEAEMVFGPGGSTRSTVAGGESQSSTAW